MRHGLCGLAIVLTASSAWSVSPEAFLHGDVDARRVTDLNRDGTIDGADFGLMLLGEESSAEFDVELPPVQSQMTAPASGARGLYGKTYIVDVAGTRYSVMDVYIRWGSAVGSGSAAERIEAVFGQSITDAATGNVNKTARYENSASLPFQHLNTSWLPGGSGGNSSWDSFLTIGCRTQGAGNSANVKADPFFLNPSASTAAGVSTVTGGSDQTSPPRDVGAGVYQSAPLDAGWETNVGTFPDSMILIGRFALKVSDIVATGAAVTMRVHTNFTGKSTSQSGGATLYTLSAANLKSDAQTTYTASGQTWTFNSGFEGTDVNQQAWTFATQTLFVPSQYATIQAAIDAAPSTGGWTVAVSPGTYNEAINLKGKAITVKSTGTAANTIIDGTSQTKSVVSAVTGETSATVLQGFTIRKGPIGTALDTYRLGGGMFINGCSPTVRDCIFSNNSAGFGGGVYGLYSSSLLQDCSFTGNSATSDGGGIQFFGGSPVIRNCTISGNNCTNNGGGAHLVQHVSGGAPTLDGCVITGNHTNVGNGGGLSIAPIASQSTTPLLSGCTITGNTARNLGGGVYAAIDPVNPGPNVTLANNAICTNASLGSKRENVWALFTDGGNSICDCLSDIDGDASVDTADISFALLFVGEVTDPSYIQPDQDMNGVVDTGDVAVLLLNFGPCG